MDKRVDEVPPGLLTLAMGNVHDIGRGGSESSGGPQPAESSRLSFANIEDMIIDWRTFDPSAIDPGSDDTLIAELLTYKKNLDMLLEHKGEYVLIKGEEIVGFYPNLATALDAGAERFGKEPALIKEIVDREQVHSSGGLAD